MGGAAGVANDDLEIEAAGKEGGRDEPPGTPPVRVGINAIAATTIACCICCCKSAVCAGSALGVATDRCSWACAPAIAAVNAAVGRAEDDETGTG